MVWLEIGCKTNNMKKVTFEKIRIRNFLSFGDEPTEFPIKPGLTFITGYNKDKDSKNGVGKSTLMVESLSFLLFGDTYRKINQKSIVNNKTNKTCIVEGWLTVNDDKYNIVRSIGPSKLFLYKNGKEITRTIPETNKDILDILGLSKEIFANTIVMNNRDSNAFITQKSESKVKFIEGILGLEVFSKMFEHTKAEANENNKKILAGLTRIKDQEASLSNDKRYQAQEHEKWTENINWLENQIRELKHVQPIDNKAALNKVELMINDTQFSINNLEQSDFVSSETDKKQVLIDSIKHIEDAFKEKDEKYRKIDVKKIQIEGSIKTETSHLKNFKEVQKECPTCKRAFDNTNKDDIEHTREDINSKIKEYQKQVLKLQEGLDKIKAEKQKTIDKILEIKKSISDIDNDIAEHRNVILELKNKVASALKEKNILLEAQTIFTKSQDKIANLEEQLSNAKEWENPFDVKVLSAENSLSLVKAEQGIMEAKQIILDAKKFATSPSGLKTSAIKKIIQTINDRLNFYLQKLNSPVRCVFDEFFEERFETNEGKEFSYGNLSGGEAKRIDFAVLFTFRDIRRLQSNVFINISVFDELFDSAIDESAMNVIIALLTETVDKTQEAFYIISHRETNIPENSHMVVQLLKENGITKII
jgi:exonuclease SbcC